MSRAALLTGFVGVLLAIGADPGFAQSATEPVKWTNVVNAAASGSRIWKNAGCAGCADAGGLSAQTIVSGDGYAEFTPVIGARLYVGLSATMTAVTDPAAIDFAFSFWPDGGWDIRERNSYRTEGRFVAGDVFRVALIGGRIKYYKNGALLYSSTASVTLPLAADTTLVGTSAAIASATITAEAPVQPCASQTPQSIVRPVEWTNVVNATPTASAIRKTAGCSGCADAGGTSVQQLTAGDGYGEFTPVFGARLYAGLSSTTTASTNPAALDFAFSFWPDGGWDIRERNAYRLEGRFVAGDVFRVALIDGRIKYFKNSTLVYTSAAPVTLPLVFDTTLVGSAASIASASIGTTAMSAGPVPVAVLTTTMPDGVLGQPYAASLAAGGGCGAYGWRLSEGSLPSGLSLSTAGLISGTLTASGSFAFTVRVTDSTNPPSYDDQALTIRVPLPAQPVAVTTTAAPSARVGQPYSAALSASGGTGVFAWTVAAGALPDGLQLDARGTLSGNPTSGGRYTFTVRATDAFNASSADDQLLTVNVLAAVPPVMYDAISDRTTRAKGPLPALGPAGYSFNDPIFHTRMARLTDAVSRPLTPGASFKTPSSTHANAWSADARYFFVMSTGGTSVPFAFDAAAMRATRLPSPTGDGGLTMRFSNEPTFSYVTPGVLYGTFSGGNLHSVDQFDLETRTYTQLLDLETLVPNLAGTYTGGIASSAGAVEKIYAFFGGTGQDRHFYLVVFEKDNPAERRLLNTLTSTVNGVPTNITLNFKIHAAAIDRSGRYVTVYPTGADLQSPRYAAPTYVWDLETNTFTPTPLVAAVSGGHDAYGYGYRVNKDCCTASTTSATWDAAQWQLRSLATPLTTTDLIDPRLQPQAVYLSSHPSWHNAQPVAMVPFFDATYRLPRNTTPWRAWDEEILAVQTEAAGTGATVWRFAHHRSVVAHDTDPTRYSFWYTPRSNVSPDGRWVLFTSNWEKTLGTDPRGDVGGTYRQDVFLAELKPAR